MIDKGICVHVYPAVRVEINRETGTGGSRGETGEQQQQQDCLSVSVRCLSYV